MSSYSFTSNHDSDGGCSGGGGNTPTRDGIIYGTSGNDVIDAAYRGDNDGDRVDANDAVLPGAAPNDDYILAGAGNDVVRAGLGNDYADGGTGNDTLYGGDGNDTLWAKEGEDKLYGGNGNDLLKGGSGNDTIDGGEGNDVMYGGDAGPIAEDGNDSFSGGNGNDTVYAGTGNDTVTGGNGRDSVDGGTGDDLIDTSGGTIDNNCGPDGLPLPDRGYPGVYPGDSDPFNDRDTVLGGAGNDTIRTGDDNDLIGGGDGNDSIDGGFDDDTITGDGGNDTIIGAEGSDSIGGGDGADLIYGGYAPGVPDGVNIPDDAGDLRPDNGRDTIDGGAGNDTIYGLDDADSITGGSGNDVIDGGIDNDVVTGGDGNDVVLGGQGNDTVGGDSGNDTLYGDAGDDAMRGDTGDDVLVAGDGNDVMEGNTGNDGFIGGGGADTMYGGDDSDVFNIGNGDDVYGGSGGNDYDLIDLTGAGPYRFVNLTTDSDGNGWDGRVEFLDADGNVVGTADFENIEDVIGPITLPCFTPGTLIATPRGEVPVETLREGDKVVTRDNGIQEVRWVGHKFLSWANLTAQPHLKPVLIRQGSLGNGLPERDMMVSPNHRMLVANDRTQLYFDEHEVLVAAKHLLTASGGIHSVDAAGVTYVHFMCDQHEVVLSNGAWTESFQPGDYTLKGIGNAQRAEILELFPELKTEAGLENYVAARRTLKKHEARLLTF